MVDSAGFNFEKGNVMAQRRRKTSYQLPPKPKVIVAGQVWAYNGVLHVVRKVGVVVETSYLDGGYPFHFYSREMLRGSSWRFIADRVMSYEGECV